MKSKLNILHVRLYLKEFESLLWLVVVSMLMVISVNLH